MAAMSKRAQARTERELHDLLHLPGNSTCADCGAPNPSWASWNLGVFLCMRCASIHRKLGTHISKVKSLSMDTWSNDQVESMKKYGNSAVNKEYNPKNRRPDMPLDADEVDSAMERFIRKKYQEKSLSDGKPEVPRRDDLPSGRPQSPDASPPPALPSKKSRFFGFGLRASSSAYPLSKHDKKHRNEPRVDSAFRIASDNLDSSRRSGGSRAEIPDHELQVKLAQLRDMGFTDNERNTDILKRHSGDVERTITTLVKLGPSEPATTKRTSPAHTVTTQDNQPTTSAQTSVSAPQSAVISQNPFEQTNQSTGFGLSYGGGSAPATAVTNTNPWQSAMSNSPTTGLEQSFSTLQVSQPLFPNTTGGYPGQPQFAPQAVPQPMQNPQQQYMVTGSPVSMNNPFMQAPLSAHSTGSNPYASHMQGIPNFAPSTNPFMNMQPSQPSQQVNPSQNFNPFGLPPTDSPPRAQTVPLAQQPQQSNIFDAQQTFAGTNLNNSSYMGPQFTAQQQFMQSNGQQSPPALQGFQYGQPQPQPQPQQTQYQQSQVQAIPNTQSPYNPYMQQQQQQQPSYIQQQQQLMPQHTGMMDKKSILALYNYPQLAPSKPLASIPEPSDEQNLVQQAYGQQQFTSPAPTGAVYNSNNNINSAKRSATMPVSSMHSAGGIGSRNPFMASPNSSTSSTPMMGSQHFGSYPQGARHTSQESIAVNNQNLQDGRHSPDAFASLSARHIRQ